MFERQINRNREKERNGMGTATARSNSNSNSNAGKKMEYRKVSFDVNEIAPDAPAGEWKMSIPRGKCKVQPTREERFPMIIVPIRLEGTEEEGEKYEKALGTELSTFLVFGGKTPQGERMAKIRIRQLCEAADVDLDLIPKEIGDDPQNELAEFIRALEGKKFTGWTIIKARKDTGEEVTELTFVNPSRTLSAATDDDDDDDDDDSSSSDNDDDKPARGKRKPEKSSSKSKRR